MTEKLKIKIKDPTDEIRSLVIKVESGQSNAIFPLAKILLVSSHSQDRITGMKLLQFGAYRRNCPRCRSKVNQLLNEGPAKEIDRKKRKREKVNSKKDFFYPRNDWVTQLMWTNSSIPMRILTIILAIVVFLALH